MRVIVKEISVNLMHPPRLDIFRPMLAIMLAAVYAVPAFESAQVAYADQSQTEAASADTHIHILPFAGTDAIVLESNGRFGIVDSGEDSDYPDGSDPRYPLRPGIVKGSGVEDAVVAYLKNLGVNSGNLEFYLGTHPHSDHIGSADEIIREFRPQRVYLAEYQDSFISDEARLWDNQYVYDRAIAAAKETGAILIQNLDPNAPVEPAPNPVEAQSDLTAVGDAPQADVLDAEGVMERFGVDPTDQDDPYNSELLPEEGIAVTRSVDPNLIHEHAPDPSTTGSPFFTLGDMNIEIVNYGDDYKFNPVPDANYFSWGVKVKAGGSTAFLAGDINNYDGDEDRLSGMIGHVDLLKLAHHGLSGSNTPSYLTALSPTYAVQTGNSSNLPEYATKTLDRLGVRYFTAPEASANGYGAVVATFARDGLHLNVMKDAATYHAFNHDPRLVLYYQGLKQAYQGWKKLGGSWYWFANSAAATQNSWIKQGGHVVLAHRLRRHGHGLGEGGRRQVVLLRRIGGHADGLGEGGRSLVLPVRLRGDADGLAQARRHLVLAGPGIRRHGHRLGEGGRRQVVLLRRLRRHALRRLDEAGLLLVLPLRLRGDADGLAEQGRLLVLAGPRLRRDGHGLGEGLGRQVVLLRRLRRHAVEPLAETRNRLVLPERIGSHANRLVAHGRSLVLDGSRIRHDGNGLARERRVMVLS